MAGVLLLSGAAAFPALAAPESASYVGEAACSACHVVEAQHWAGTLHARASRGSARTPLGERGCESCHGPGSAHVADTADRSAIVAFTAGSGATPEQMNAMCLQCHRGGPLLHWKGSVHE